MRGGFDSLLPVVRFTVDGAKGQHMLSMLHSIVPFDAFRTCEVQTEALE